MAVALLVATTPGCMNVALQMELAEPTKHGSIISTVGLGLVGDVLLAGSVAAVHGQADADPDSDLATMFPYYAAPLILLDALVYLVVLESVKD